MLRIEVFLLIWFSISFASSQDPAVASNAYNDLVFNLAPPETWPEPSGFQETGFIRENANEDASIYVEDYHAAHYNEEIPTNFDLRTVWNKNCLWMSKISDQGHCLSCWAVATADVIRDRLCMTHKNKIGYLASAAEFMNCFPQAKHDACNAGHPLNALNYFAETGTVTGGPYHFPNTCKPYQIPPAHRHRDSLTSYCPAKCTDPDYNGTYEGDKIRGENVRGFKGKNIVQDIQLEILHNGPVVAGFDVYPSFNEYWNNAPKGAVYRKHASETSKGGHVIRIVGWGTTDDGTDYWTFLNSWGNDSHRQGEGRFLR